MLLVAVVDSRAAGTMVPADAARYETAAAPRIGHWRHVLDDLLVLRAHAFAAGRPAMLGAVYQARSPVLTHDRAMLRSWQRRGLRVSTPIQLRRVRLVAHPPGRVVLRTVDRLDHPVAIAGDGSRRRLPQGRATAHRVLLVATPKGWRIGAVRVLSG